MGIKRFEKLVVGGGFEPPKIKSADLQSIFLNLKKNNCTYYVHII